MGSATLASNHGRAESAISQNEIVLRMFVQTELKASATPCMWRDQVSGAVNQCDGHTLTWKKLIWWGWKRAPFSPATVSTHKVPMMFWPLTMALFFNGKMTTEPSEVCASTTHQIPILVKSTRNMPQ